jgi:hypothetical protein
MANFLLPLPSAFVSGKSVLRATTIAVELLALPPGCDIPPEVAAGRPKSEARYFVVFFSTRVRTGETW